MQVSSAFREHVLATALKGFRHDMSTGLLVHDMRLSASEINRLVETAINVYGISVPSEARLAINGILAERDPFSGAPESATSLRLDNIPSGDIVTLTHNDGAEISLIAIGDMEFRVLADSSRVLITGDSLYPLALRAAINAPLYFEITRGNQRFPDNRLYYAVNPVTAISVTRNNISAMRDYMADVPAEDDGEIYGSFKKARAFNADFTGRTFNSSALVDESCDSAIFEIDLEQMSLYLNIAFVLADESRHDAVIAEIARVCDTDGSQLDNVYRIVCTSPGIVELAPSGGSTGTYDINIVQPPTVTQR